MVGPRAPLGKLTDHIKGMLGSRPTEGTAPKLSLSDLRNGGKSAAFDDSDDESSDSDSSSSGSDSDDDNKTSFLRKISQTNAAAASPATTKSTTKPTTKANGAAISTPTPAPKLAAKTNGTAVKKAVVKSESSSSETSSDESESDSESEKGTAKKPAQNGKKVVTAESSSESSSDESSSESEEEEAPKKKAEKAANTKAASKPLASAPTTSTSSSAATSSSSSRSASVESSESKEDEEEEESEKEDLAADGADSDEEMADQSFAIATRENGDSQVVNNIPQFATQGFELRRADDTNDASDVARVFRQAKLEGKQLWYFTAPSSVPITVVEKMAIPVEKAEQGKAILSHEGQDYGMSFDDALTSKTIKLLIPNKAGDKYSILDRTIDKTMHLKRVTRFSQEEGEDAVADADLALQAPVAAKKQPRKQPEGLRARYLPIGVNDTVNSSKKRKHGDTTAVAPAAPADSDDESDGGAAVKASKKKNKATEASAEPSPKKARKDKSADKEAEKSPKKEKKPASVVPLPPIPGFTAAPVHKVTPVAPPVLPPSALKAPSTTASEKMVKKKSSDSGNKLPSSSQVSYSQIDTPSKIVVDDKVVSKKSKDKKRAVVDEADADAMDVDGDGDAAPAESSPEKKKKKDKKEKSEKKEKKDKKEKREKKEKKEHKASKDDDDSVATPVASLAASAVQPKKVTPVPLPRIN